jgi:hypothetical protein
VSAAVSRLGSPVCKFGQQAVAGVLDDAAVVLFDLRIDELLEMRLQASMRAAPIRRE